VASTTLGTVVGIINKFVCCCCAQQCSTDATRRNYIDANKRRLDRFPHLQAVPHDALGGWLHAGLLIIPLTCFTFAHGFPLVRDYWYDTSPALRCACNTTLSIVIPPIKLSYRLCIELASPLTSVAPSALSTWECWRSQYAKRTTLCTSIR
jgi:hypothetical protein